MDKELTIQDLEAQADALLAAADEMEELLPADTGKSKRKKAEDEAPEKKAPPLDEKVLAGLPAAEQLQKSEKLRDLFAKGKQKGKLDSDEITEVLDELDLDDDGRERASAASSSRTIWTSRRWRPSPRSRRRSWSTPMIWWTASPSTIRCVCTSRRSARCPCSPPTRRSRSRPG